MKPSDYLRSCVEACCKPKRRRIISGGGGNGEAVALLESEREGGYRETFANIERYLTGEFATALPQYSDKPKANSGASAAATVADGGAGAASGASAEARPSGNLAGGVASINARYALDVDDETDDAPLLPTRDDHLDDVSSLNSRRDGPQPGAAPSAATAESSTLKTILNNRYVFGTLALTAMVGLVAEIAFEVFTYQTITKFFLGDEAKSLNEVETPSFLAHMDFSNPVSRQAAHIISILIIVGDGLTNLLTVNPIGDLRDAIKDLTSHSYLTDVEWETLQRNRDEATWFKQWGGTALFKVLPILAALAHFVAGAATDPDAIINSFDNKDTQRGLGYPLWAGAVIYYFILYLPLLVKHLRRAENSYYSEEGSLKPFLQNIVQHPFSALVTAIETLIILSARTATFVFLGLLAWTDLPILGVPTPQSALAKYLVQGIEAGASVFTVGMTRTLAVVGKYYPKDWAAFRAFWADHQLNNSADWLHGIGWKEKCVEILKAVSWGAFPAWISGNFIKTAVENDGDLPQWANGLLGGALALVSAGLMYSYYRSVPLQQKIKAFDLREKIKDLATKLGVVSEGGESVQQINPDSITAAETKLREFRSTLAAIKLAPNSTLRQQYTQISERVDKAFGWVSEQKHNLEALCDSVKQLYEWVTKIENDNAEDDLLTEAQDLYNQYAEQFTVSTHRMATYFATTINHLSQTARQLALIHFTQVLALTWFHQSSGVYNHALVFALSLGLPMYLNTFDVYQKPLAEHCESIGKWVGQTRAAEYVGQGAAWVGQTRFGQSAKSLFQWCGSGSKGSAEDNAANLAHQSDAVSEQSLSA